jgi:hypothetical protein
MPLQRMKRQQSNNGSGGVPYGRDGSRLKTPLGRSNSRRRPAPGCPNYFDRQLRVTTDLCIASATVASKPSGPAPPHAPPHAAWLCEPRINSPPGLVLCEWRTRLLREVGKRTCRRLGLAQQIIAQQIIEPSSPGFVGVAANVDAPGELHLTGFGIFHVDIDVQDEVAHLLPPPM